MQSNKRDEIHCHQRNARVAIYIYTYIHIFPACAALACLKDSMQQEVEMTVEQDVQISSEQDLLLLIGVSDMCCGLGKASSFFRLRG